MAALIVYAALAYLALGVGFAIPFALRGVGAVDDAARAPHWGFRLLVIPGAAALWPLMLSKWLSACRRPLRETHP
jgi:hypothetical protein